MSTLTAPPAGIPYASPSTPKPNRLISLDLFRGLTVAGMLLVNNPGPGGQYAPLIHASETPAWHGWTPTDLVFPFFLFIMGVAIPFSFSKRAATDSKRELFLHILARGVSLFLLGDFLYGLPRTPPTLPAGFEYLTGVRVFVYAFLLAGFVLLLYPWKSKRISIALPFVFLVGFVVAWNVIAAINAHAVADGLSPKVLGGGLLNPDRLRIPGVLQRIGAVYVVAASLGLFCKRRGLIIAAVGLLVVYTVLMACVPYPSLAHPGETVRGLWAEEDNLARYVDLAVFTSKTGNHVYGEYPDPEGLLSTLPAIVTSVLGILTGLWLRTDRTLADRCAAILAVGVLAVLAGYALSALGIPINKPLWTPSYVLVCAGLAMLGLGTFFYLSDIHLVRKPFLPLKWYGMNAIAAFVLAGLVARINSMIRWHVSDTETVSLGQYWSTHLAEWGRHVTFVGDAKHNGSLAYALSFVIAVGLVMGLMHRAKIFLKV